ALESDKLRVVLTSDGAALDSLQLKGDKYKRTHEPKGDLRQVDLAEVAPGQLPPLSTTLRGSDPAAAPRVPPTASYEVIEQSANRVVFRTEAKGVSIRKT